MGASSLVTLEVVVVNRNNGLVEAAPKMPVSAPSPRIILDYAGLQLEPSQPANPSPGFKGELHISGRVLCGVCDITPGPDGTIDELRFFQGYEDHLYDVPLTVTKGVSDNLGRPFPYEGAFNVLLPLTTLDSGNNLFLLRANDKVLGRTGDLEFVFQVNVASSNLDDQPQEVQEDPNVPWIVELAATRIEYHIASGDEFFHPLLCRVHLAEGGTSAQAAVQTLSGKRNVVAGPDGQFYLADAGGTKPQVLLLLAEDVEPPFMKDKSPQSPFRRLDGQAPHSSSPQQDWFRLGFQYGFLAEGLSLTAGRDTLAKMALHKNLILNASDSMVQMSWDWGKKAAAFQVLQPPYATPTSAWVDKTADMLFHCLSPNSGSDDLVSTFLMANWQNIQMEGYPEEQRHVLEFATEFFQELAASYAASHSAEVGRNLGDSYREMLALMAPLCDPATTVQRHSIGKLDFLKLYSAAAKTAPKVGGWFGKLFSRN